MSKIQECKCGAKYNVERFQPGTKFKCKVCGEILGVPVAEAPTPIPIPETPKPIPSQPRATPPRPRAPESRRPAREEEAERPRPIRQRPAPAPEVPEPVEEDAEVPRARRTPPPSREEAVEQRREPARRPTPPPAEPEPAPPEPEPEETIEEISADVLLRKEDYSKHRDETLARVPKFLPAFLINGAVFAAVLIAGIVMIGGFAKPQVNGEAERIAGEFNKRSEKIDATMTEKLQEAMRLGTVNSDTVYKGVREKFAKAAHRASFGTVSVISDLDIYDAGTPVRIPYKGGGFAFVVDGAKNYEGYIVTCYENIAGARSVKVLAFDGRQYDAKIVAYDVPSNIAVLQIDVAELKKNGTALEPIEWGDSDEAKKKVASYVFTCGSPFGMDRSVALGSVSCPDRYTVYSIRTGEACGFYNQLFQTDAAVNWGSTGGPLVNLDGQVIGVCVAGLHKAFGLTDYNGLYFAIHSNFARKIANALARNSRVDRSYTGILVDSLKALELDPDFRGVAVVGVEPDSPAASSALSAGDIFYAVSYMENNAKKEIKLNARHTPDLPIIYDALASLPPNTEVTFLIKDRTGENKPPVVIKTVPLPRGGSDVVNAERWGIVVSPVSKTTSMAFGTPDGKGVMVVAVMDNSPASRAMIQVGTIILAIDNKSIDDIKIFRTRYDNLRADRRREVTFDVKRPNAFGMLGAYGNDFIKILVIY
ncbi:MAG: trypsin-like peptidase domain-containing protein [Candidatus Brocadiia bacterium]